jgi:hypothetical protein
MAPYGGPDFFGMAGPSAPFGPSYAPPPTNGWPGNGGGHYGFYSPSVPNPFQQQNPPFPSPFVGGTTYPASPHSPSFPNHFPGQGVMPSPVPYGSYPHYPTGRPPFPTLGMDAPTTSRSPRKRRPSQDVLAPTMFGR